MERAGRSPEHAVENVAMHWNITLLLLLLWLMGFIASASLTSWVHLLLPLAVVSAAFNVMHDRRTPH